MSHQALRDVEADPAQLKEACDSLGSKGAHLS